MTNLLRFDFNDRDGIFEVIENGDWVRATDYDSIQAKLAEVEAERDKFHQLWKDACVRAEAAEAMIAARSLEGENKLALAIAELVRLGFDFESIVGRKLKGQTE